MAKVRLTLWATLFGMLLINNACCSVRAFSDLIKSANKPRKSKKPIDTASEKNILLLGIQFGAFSSTEIPEKAPPPTSWFGKKAVHMVPQNREP